MKIGIVTIFPEMFVSITDYGIIGKAVKNGFLEITCWNPRNFSNGFNFPIDGRPYGGGTGMIMLAKPIKQAIYAAKNYLGEGAKVIYLTPQGCKLNQSGVLKLSLNKKMIFVCGRYKGIDERLVSTEIDEEWSIGDYVLTGGELASMVLIDAISRYVPGVLKNRLTLIEDSFSHGLLGSPCYTRPKVF
ncbi:MAG: tRNA m(1)G37 methyltransferase [Candidatus Westeberhardia cardiocondylae]|nr:tRNA m(1)G37 methyltransferase [Candidatus Westeberhardia cardiocondylae]